MVSSKDVAKLAGVSVSTVSRVFSNTELVNETTAKRVMDAARQLNYVPNISARNLKLQKSNLLGVALSDISNSFYLEVLKDVFSLSESKYRFVVVFSSEDKAHEIESVETLIASNTACVLFTPVAGGSARVEAALKGNHVPALQLYRRSYEDFDSLTIDDAYGAYLATHELLNAGHRDILFLDYNVEIPTGRYEGYLRAYSEAGLKPNIEDFVRIDIKGDVNTLVAHVMREKNYTAVVPVSSLLAHAAIGLLHSWGKKIGQDVSVIIYDDMPLARFSDISVISHPFGEISGTIIRMIQNRLSDPDSPACHEVISPFLIERNSIKQLSR